MSQFIEMFGDPIKNSKKLPTRKGEELFVFSSGKANTKSNLSNDFPFNCYGGNGITGHSDQWLIDYPTIVIGRVGEYCGCVHKTHGKVWITDNAIYIKEHKEKVFNETFLFYLMTYIDFHRLADETGQPKITQRPLLTMDYIIPAKDLQEQFVAIAHQADKSEFGDIKSQFIEMFGNGNWEQRSLGEVGTFKRGGGFQKSDYVEHGIPCIHYGQIHTKFGPFIYSHISEISSDLATKTKFASKGDLIIAITSEDAEGSCKSTAWLGDYPVAVGGHAAIYNHCMNPLYMSFFFKSTLFNYAKMEYIHGTKVVEIKPDDIAKILVPCPPMSLQERFSAIAEQADKSESECHLSINDLNNSINYN